MFRSYVKIAFRFLLKNKKFTIINIVGLSLGVLCCLYIVLYVKDQYSYDRHHADAKDIYRITSSLKLPGDKANSLATTSPPVAPALKNDFGEVREFARMIPTSMVGVKEHLLRYRDRSFYEKDAAYVDSTFFKVFSYRFISGSAASALNEPYSVVLLKATADKLFGQNEPVGNLIEINNSFGKHDFRVAGVVDEGLGKSYVHANIFITMNSGDLGSFILGNHSWSGANFVQSFVKLSPGANAVALEKKLPAFLMKYGEQQLKSAGMEKELHLQPLLSIHTTKGYDAEMGKTVSPSFLYILLMIAVLIQIIACINFMNLTTARASKRAKEVGVRKVIGAERKDLVKQFLGESFLLSFVGVLLALPLLWIAIPYLNNITKADIHLSLFLTDYRLWLLLAGLMVVTGLIAGSYPSFYLSAFKAIRVLKGDLTNHISAAGIRRSLVVFQFILSTVLITCITIIYFQLNYINSKDLGFDKDQKLIFSFHTDDTKKKMHSFISDMRGMPEVSAVTKADSYLGQGIFHDMSVYPAGGNAADAQGVTNISSDEYFLKATGIKLISGRDLRLFDSSKVLINETFAKKMGLDARSAPGKRLYSQGNRAFEVAGVMKDFNFSSLHDNVKSFMLIYDPDGDNLDHIIVNTSSRNYRVFLDKIEAIWHRDLPESPFEFSFLDDEMQKQYETEATLSQIINSFTLMAVLISCLGLFGLAAFTSEQRTKEIGIRKVLGASTLSLTALLSREFLQLVLIAFAIAAPVSWWAMKQWLQGFAYRIDISWWMFAIAGFLVVFIALLTVSFQTIKAALTNPIRSLRSE